MGIIYEIGKVNSELNDDIIGTLVSDTYDNYHGYPHSSFVYSNDLYGDNFGIDVVNETQDFLFVKKRIYDDRGTKIDANFWDGWQGYCWGVVSFESINSYIEIFTNFNTAINDSHLKDFKDFYTPLFSTNSSVEFRYVLTNEINIAIKESLSTIANYNSGISSSQFRFGIRIQPFQGFLSINIVIWEFGQAWSSPPHRQFKYFFTSIRKRGLGLRLSGNIKLYDFYFI
jgi:hypothetical protein